MRCRAHATPSGFTEYEATRYCLPRHGADIPPAQQSVRLRRRLRCPSPGRRKARNRSRGRILAAASERGLALAQICIDVDRPVGRVDRRIFGGFIEHLGRCSTAACSTRALRSPMRGLPGRCPGRGPRPKAPILRWPGGNFVSGYHWADGVGPSPSAPARELAVERESPTGSAPIVHRLVQGGRDEPASARTWAPGPWTRPTHGWSTATAPGIPTGQPGGQRAPGAVRVRYWGLGNEMYGAWQSARTADDYVNTARECAKAMSRTTRHRAGLLRADRLERWDRVVSRASRRSWTPHRPHLHRGPTTTGPTSSLRTTPNGRSASRRPHRADALQPADQPPDRRRLRRVERLVPDRRRSAWRSGTTWRTRWPSPPPQRLSSASAAVVPIANLAQLVNVIAPIVTNPEGLFLPDHLPSVAPTSAYTRNSRCRRSCGLRAPRPCRRAHDRALGTPDR